SGSGGADGVDLLVLRDHRAQLPRAVHQGVGRRGRIGVARLRLVAGEGDVIDVDGRYQRRDLERIEQGDARTQLPGAQGVVVEMRSGRGAGEDEHADLLEPGIAGAAD